MRDRLRAARLALKAKQDDLSALWGLSNRQVVSDWERDRQPIPDEVVPKIEQLEGWAAAGGTLDAVREEIAKIKDAELAAQIERAHSKATSWQAMGSRPVPLIEQPAQLTLEGAAPTTPAPRPVPAAAAPSPDPYTTINWESFVVELDGVRGISLRELVERGGLYSKIEHAVRALLRSGLDFYSSEVKVAMGRPRKEYLFRNVNDAIEFCIIAASPTAHQIRRLLMAHHLEFQRLITGDAGAKERLADAQATHERIAAAPPAPALSPTMVALQAAMEHEAKIIQLQHDVAALQRAEAIRREESERMLARLKGAGLPEPTVDAPALTTRKALVAQLARVGMDAGNGRDHHHAAWVHLYSQYEHRAGVDLRLRAINAGQKTLEYAETHGHLDALYALACELWPTDGAGARA
jgi:transcriptional regulator with XRE-family HTH domain